MEIKEPRANVWALLFFGRLGGVFYITTIYLLKIQKFLTTNDKFRLEYDD